MFVAELPHTSGRSAVVPLVIVVHCRTPEAQLTLNSTPIGSPTGTSTTWGLAPSTTQLGATLPRVTVRAPGATPVTTTVSFRPIGCSGPSSTRAVYPSSSVPEPVVEVEIAMPPRVAIQVSSNDELGDFAGHYRHAARILPRDGAVLGDLEQPHDVVPGRERREL